jgi:hypothetical protein
MTCVTLIALRVDCAFRRANTPAEPGPRLLAQRPGPHHPHNPGPRVSASTQRGRSAASNRPLRQMASSARIPIPQCVPETIKRLALAICAAARLCRIHVRKLPPLGKNLFSADVEFGKGIDLVLDQPGSHRCPVLLHVGLRSRLSLNVMGSGWSSPAVCAAWRSVSGGQRPSPRGLANALARYSQAKKVFPILRCRV